MKSFERESFIKSLLLYFLTIELLVGALFYHTFNEEVASLEQQLFLEMKNYNFDFTGDKFTIGFVPEADARPLLELQKNDRELFVFFPLHADRRYALKIFYPKSDFDRSVRERRDKYLLAFSLVSLVVGIIALGFAYYTLKPLRRALTLLDDFIKNIIHDINTPLGAIMLNASMLPKNLKAAARIEKGARTLQMLHRNLQEYGRNLPQHTEPVDLDVLVGERLAFFRELYPSLNFRTALHPLRIYASPDALTRILDNLLSNACKYNTVNGDVVLRLDHATLTVENDTRSPIRQPQKLFERFYRESERGMGIGLHIAKSLCDASHIGISVIQREGRVVFTLDFSLTLR